MSSTFGKIFLFLFLLVFVSLAYNSIIEPTTDIIMSYRNKLQDRLVGVPPDKRKPLPKQRFSTQSFLGLCYTIREFPWLPYSQL
jgi:hypothetical protein